MNKSKRVRQLMNDAKINLNEDFSDDDGEIFDLKQTISYFDLSKAQQQQIKDDYYGTEYSPSEIKESLLVRQCVTVDTSKDKAIIEHKGFQLWDESIGLETYLSYDKECEVATKWASELVDKLLNENY